MSKKPAVSTLLKNALSEVEALKKKVESADSTAKWANQRADKAESELQQIHAFLDAVPNPPLRKIELDYGAKQDVSAMTRLSVYLATKV